MNDKFLQTDNCRQANYNLKVKEHAKSNSFSIACVDSPHKVQDMRGTWTTDAHKTDWYGRSKPPTPQAKASQKTTLVSVLGNNLNLLITKYLDLDLPTF